MPGETPFRTTPYAELFTALSNVDKQRAQLTEQQDRARQALRVIEGVLGEHLAAAERAVPTQPARSPRECADSVVKLAETVEVLRSSLSLHQKLEARRSCVADYEPFSAWKTSSEKAMEDLAAKLLQGGPASILTTHGRLSAVDASWEEMRDGLYKEISHRDRSLREVRQEISDNDEIRTASVKKNRQNADEGCAVSASAFFLLPFLAFVVLCGINFSEGKRGGCDDALNTGCSGGVVTVVVLVSLYYLFLLFSRIMIGLRHRARARALSAQEDELEDERDRLMRCCDAITA